MNFFESFFTIFDDAQSQETLCSVDLFATAVLPSTVGTDCKSAPSGAKQSFEGLTGMALDNKMVEFEQSKVQEFINGYKGNDLGEIITEINGLMSNPLAPGDVSKVMKESFDGGKSFNFKNYADRVKLGQELIKKAHNE